MRGPAVSLDWIVEPIPSQPVRFGDTRRRELEWHAASFVVPTYNQPLCAYNSTKFGVAVKTGLSHPCP